MKKRGGQQLLTYAAAALLLWPMMAMAQDSGVVRHYDWVVDYAFWRPDCVEKLLIAVNGVYPGPTIEGNVGDTIVVAVTNKMPTEGVVIHWHGMYQRGTPWADGAAYVSQCPINPDEEFTYTFTLDNAGTYFWHGHYGMQRAAGFYGSIIVYPRIGVQEPFEYDGELSIVLNDWWHRSMYDQELGLFSDPFVWIGEPQSLLIEGKGAYNCSLVQTDAVPNSGDAVTCNATAPQCSPYILPVEAGKIYRLRIASVASLGSFNFLLEGHSFRVVEADGHYVEEVELTNIDVYSGETYSVLFTADQNASRNYWAAVNVRGRRPQTPTGLAVLNYLPNPNTTLPTTPQPSSPPWDDYEYSMNQASFYRTRAEYVVSLPTGPVTRNISLLNTQNKLNGKYKWALNNLTFAPTSTPVLGAVRFGLNSSEPAANIIPPDQFSPADYDIYSVPTNPNTSVSSSYYEFQTNDYVEVILQNANSLTENVSEVHPWHLHGQDFWVLGFGNGMFTQEDYTTLNYNDPPLRNTVPLFPHGWTVIRFVADNPGAWPFHCHIESHFHMGMGVVFVVGAAEIAMMDVPLDSLGCGLTKGIKP